MKQWAVPPRLSPRTRRVSGPGAFTSNCRAVSLAFVAALFLAIPAERIGALTFRHIEVAREQEPPPRVE